MNPANAPSATTGLFQGHISAVPHSSAPRPVVSQSALNTSPVHSAVHHPLALSYSAPFAAPPPFEGIVDFTSSHAPTSGAAYPTHGSQYPPVQPPMSLAARTDSVDWKQSPFFTYRPNEVKHRKRTTRQQLKVLEETFHKTQKPDGNVRKALALQLNMTPRNVQVWFQNRRAKDKNMAKRASTKLVDEDSHATLESTSPTTPIPKAEASGVFSERSFEQCIDFVSSPNEYRHEFAFAPSSTASSSPATAHPDLNGSTSPVEEMFNRKFEISSPPAISSGFPQAVSGSNIPSAVAHAGFSVEEVASQPIALPRNIFAPRKSLPHIRAPAFGQDLQHQRSTSTPSFIPNVDNMSDLPLPTCVSIDGVLSMYPQTNGQSVYGSRYPIHDRVRRMPSGPLPTSNYSFGMASSQQPARETEHEFDPSFGRYAQFNTVSGSNTPTSVSGFSQYQSVADSFEEDHAQAPYGWYPGRRGSSSQHVPSREFSPVSNGYSSGSPRPGTEPSTEPETEAHDGAVYMTGRNEWSAYTEEYKSNVTTSPENKQPIGYQEIFGYNGMPITSEDGYLMAQTVANSAVYQPMMNGHAFVQQVPYTSDNQTPMVGFQSTAPVGYNYA